jgi:hypothetical protein
MHRLYEQNLSNIELIRDNVDQSLLESEVWSKSVKSFSSYREQKLDKSDAGLAHYYAQNLSMIKLI